MSNHALSANLVNPLKIARSFLWHVKKDKLVCHGEKRHTTNLLSLPPSIDLELLAKPIHYDNLL